MFNYKPTDKEATSTDFLAAIAWDTKPNADGSITVSKAALARIERHLKTQTSRANRERQFAFEARLRKLFGKITRSEPRTFPACYRDANGKMIAIWEYVDAEDEEYRGWIIPEFREGDHILARPGRYVWDLQYGGNVIDELVTWPSGHRMALLPHRYPQWRRTISLSDVMLDPQYHPERSKQYA